MNHTEENSDIRFDVAVVGGGLAGLIAATLIGRQGRSVVLFEQAKQPGGRAQTTVKNDVRFNLGPRALYQSGDALRLLRKLNVAVQGAPPNAGIPLGYYQGREYRLPTSLGSLLTTHLLSIRDKWKLTRFLKSLPSLKTESLHRISSLEWLTDHFGTGALASFLGALFRLTTYAGDLSRLSASAAIEQLQIALGGNVLYIDGGWQSLVDGLREQAHQAGVTIRSSSHVTAVESVSGEVMLTTSRGFVETVTSAILAVGPDAACSLLRLPADHELVLWADRRQPVRAACLDVALTQLPRPGHRFALGLDRPLYLSVHSAAAHLAPEGVAVIHVMKYLASNTIESAGGVEQELELMLDRVQPGWRTHLLTRRTLPLMTVAHSHPEPREGGINGRPAVTVEGYPGIYVAGDWVGGRSQLADAAAASAETAAQLLLQSMDSAPRSDHQYV
ncbi:MAG: NAD(P)/FAD-dependent oxidoreductase [Planctomycetes bacterium]|nr:NAD(P)/FAD-dependent oxidoreductase [Planctomycetota bacterium]